MKFDHINISAPADVLAKEKDYLCEVFDLTLGERPNFKKHGYWLYAKDQAVIHLTESDKHVPNTKNAYIDHIAFQLTGVADFVKKLQAQNIQFDVTYLSDVNCTQVFFNSPAGIGLEANFKNESLKKVVIIGNSGSGKSTLAKKMVTDVGCEHLDLDTLAWQATTPPTRKPINESKDTIDDFLSKHYSWVIEGCYSDLVELVLDDATELVFLDLPASLCVENAKQRPWEPHKYPSKEAQDANLSLLIDWIKNYDDRKDEFSRKANQKVYENFAGTKQRIIEN